MSIKEIYVDKAIPWPRRAPTAGCDPVHSFNAKDYEIWRDGDTVFLRKDGVTRFTPWSNVVGGDPGEMDEFVPGAAGPILKELYPSDRMAKARAAKASKRNLCSGTHRMLNGSTCEGCAGCNAGPP